MLLDDHSVIDFRRFSCSFFLIKKNYNSVIAMRVRDYWNNQYWTTCDTSNSGLLDHSISCIAIEDSNNIWIGSWDSGLVKFDGER